MSLNPVVQEFLRQIPQIDEATLRSIPMEDRRKITDEMIKLWSGQPQPIHQVDDRLIPGPGGEIPIRIYKPEGNGPFPILVYFHGGGFCVGSIETEEAPVRSQANVIGCITVSVDYRLAPEHKFPAAVEDCYAATVWATENASRLGGDPTRVAVSGASAGGNMAAVVALMARDKGGPTLVCQVLLYPVLNYAFDTPSYHENAEGYLLARNDLKEFWNLYLQNESDGDNPYASPLRAPDLSGLAPALVITAEYDPLRDDGEAYAVRLRDSGVPVVCKRYDGWIHGGLPMEIGQEATEQTNAYLKAVFTVH